MDINSPNLASRKGITSFKVTDEGLVIGYIFPYRTLFVPTLVDWDLSKVISHERKT